MARPSSVFSKTCAWFGAIVDVKLSFSLAVKLADIELLNTAVPMHRTNNARPVPMS